MSAFKGRLSNVEACDTVASALKKRHVRCRVFPIGDGGAGTMQSVHFGVGGEFASVPATGPLGKAVRAKVLLLPNAKAPTAIYLESSEVCGHSLVHESERDAMRATSQGLGELILEAVKNWGSSLERVYIGLGDSAVSDMGMGMLGALGFTFLDAGNRPLWGNALSLRQIQSWRDPRDRRIEKLKFTVLCDVMNPLCGPRGSARTFSAQKGATLGQVSQIEEGMMNLATLVQKITGRDMRNEPMTGSAGGLAAAFRAFFPSDLVLGARFLLDWVQFDRTLSDYALLIVGEGKTDAQSLSGKAPAECLSRAESQGKRTLILSGAVGEGLQSLTQRPGMVGCYACGETPTPRDALYEKTLSLFSDESFLKSLS